MGHRAIAATAAAFVLSSILSSASRAGPIFDHPPQGYWAGWVTPFPYQRNIFWEYGVDPRGSPSATGAPGAEYYGTNDTTLRVTDFVAFADDTSWYVSLAGTTNAGLTGIDNRAGANPKKGSLKHFVNNEDADNPTKNIHLE